MINNERILQNRYLVEQQIGAGGMGAVYLGVDQRFGTSVAIKESISPGSTRLSRAFEHEAQLLNSLRHPALPHVIDYFVEGDSQFIVMEYIDGEDLSAMIERGEVFAITDVLRWADDLLDALNYLHTQKFPVIHRDIKPQNLKLTPAGKIILLDFGLAKGNPADLSQLTMTKSIFGYSRIYASLEQIQGSGTDPRSDLYSLAATLYHLLTGRTPVDALTRAKSVLSEESDLLQTINFFNHQVPIGVAEVLHQALALNANVRPQTANEMRTALKFAVFPAANSDEETRVLKTAPNEHLIENFDESVLPIDDPFARKLQIKIKPIDAQPVQSQLPAAKNSFHPAHRGIKIAAAILSVCGVTFAISTYYPLFVQDTNLKTLQADFVIKTTRNESNELTPQNKSDLAVSSLDTVSHESATSGIDKLDDKEETIVDEPTIIPINESAKTNRSREKSITFVKIPNIKKTEKAVAVKDEQSRESKELVVEKLEKNERNSGSKKSGGFKGLLNKIGSGARRLPKAIFSKKKD
ncbi:MAG: serine/threonine-protein kinase [Pyrinomonadaceae bacterium]